MLFSSSVFLVEVLFFIYLVQWSLSVINKMKITVTSLENECFLLDVSEDLELENFKAFCEVQSGISAHEISIEFQGIALLDNKKTLKDYNIQDGDLVLLKRVRVPRTSNAPGEISNL